MTEYFTEILHIPFPTIIYISNPMILSKTNRRRILTTPNICLMLKPVVMRKMEWNIIFVSSHPSHQM